MCVCELGSKDLEREDVCALAAHSEAFFFRFFLYRGGEGEEELMVSVPLTFLNSKIAPQGTAKPDVTVGPPALYFPMPI